MSSKIAILQWWQEWEIQRCQMWEGHGSKQLYRATKSHEIFMFVCKKEPNNAVILKCLIIMQCFGHQPEHWAQSMFVVSHHCLTTKHDRTHWSSTRKISTIAVCDITALFDIYLVETDIDISRYLGTLFGVNRHWEATCVKLSKIASGSRPAKPRLSQANVSQTCSSHLRRQSAYKDPSKDYTSS